VLRSEKERGVDLEVGYVNQEKTILAHDLANVARRRGGSFIGPGYIYLRCTIGPIHRDEFSTSMK
jgi:hypothetical protein